MAGIILGAVGSLSKTYLRLHMSVSDSRGKCIGGHVAYDCEVHTTLELVIGLVPDVTFQRVFDEITGFKELKVSKVSNRSFS